MLRVPIDKGALPKFVALQKYLENEFRLMLLKSKFPLVFESFAFHELKVTKPELSAYIKEYNRDKVFSFCSNSFESPETLFDKYTGLKWIELRLSKTNEATNGIFAYLKKNRYD